nr:DEAD/DEAH box helicase [Mesoterricola sediminis]
MDFDKEGWREDLQAFARTCRSWGVPVSLERSRSGSGGHAWIFFREPVPAILARKLGSFLLTETMDSRHQLAMSSYDRLFPNQDTLPKGGFGNLIVLPLQFEARKTGNTLFLDEALEPHADPWTYLATVERMAPGEVETLVEKASSRGRILGVRFDAIQDGYELTPWERPPSGKARNAVLGPMPERVGATLSSQIFLEKAGLPQAFLAEAKRLASFQNPEFYQKQGMRFSTNGTPRIICAAEDHPAHLALPRGCRKELENLLTVHGSRLEVEDLRFGGQPIQVEFQGTLTALQEAGSRALMEEDIGIFVGPPGTGKTVLGAFMTAARGVNTLILVHRKPLMEQWRAQLQAFLGLDAKEIGQIGGGRHKATGRIDVAMIQSLATREGVLDLVGEYGHVIVDECHHAPAVSFERVMRAVRARFVLGLTATPFRRDGLQRLLHFQCGEIRFQGSASHGHPFANRLVLRETRFFGEGAIQDLYAALVYDPMRNAQIAKDVRDALGEGRSPIVLTERKDHLERLKEALQDAAQHVVILHGGIPAKQRRLALERLAEVPERESRLILGIGRYIGEGFDDPRLDTLVLAMPIAWKGTLVQYAGRLHRLREGKEEVRIYDYQDASVPVFRKMFEKRLRTYRSMGYQPGETSGQGALFTDTLDEP